MHNAIPIGLQTLLDLHAERPLTPQRIAHLTNNKADRIRDYLRVCSEQADGWRTTAAQVRRFGNDSEMGLHAGMFDYFNEFAVLLRRALLLVDDQPESRSK